MPDDETPDVIRSLPGLALLFVVLVVIGALFFDVYGLVY